MKCPYSILVKTQYGSLRRVPCGQCTACRLNKAREWSIRIMHETLYHEDSVFLTLTFDDDHLPEEGTISKRDVQLFMKRLRKRLKRRIRYFCSGEYGEKSFRPHYHLILFGISVDDDVFSNKLYSGKDGFQCLMKEWPYGMAFVGMVTYDSACYVAKYTLKKVTGRGAKEYYEKLGVEPEFALMSRKPGIGSEYFIDNKDRLVEREYCVGKGGAKVALPRFYKDKIFADNPLLREFLSSKKVKEAYQKVVKEAKERGLKPSEVEVELAQARENLMRSFISMKGVKNEV